MKTADLPKNIERKFTSAHLPWCRRSYGVPGNGGSCSHFAWALVGLVIAVLAILGLSACAPAPRIIVVRCDYGAVPVGYHGMTAQDSADEAWRDSLLCEIKRAEIDLIRWER